MAALTGAAFAVANPAPAPVETPAAVLPFVLPDHPLAARQVSETDSSSRSRADDESPPDCTTKLFDIVQGRPRYGPQVSSWLLESIYSAMPSYSYVTKYDDSLTTICDSTISPPASLSSEFSNWQDQRSSWVTRSSDAIKSVATSCGGEMSVNLEGLLVTDYAGCTSMVLKLVDIYQSREATQTSTWGKTSTVSQTSGSSSSSTSGAAPPQETETEGEGGSSTTAGAGGAADPTPSTSLSTGGAAAPRETGMFAAAAAVVVGVAGVMVAL
ncbi:hypothetical protein C8A00DRAFT_33794 [Chaetomidium leptoderma]|uniref:Uncharacterized protein n=1 Tax=Chaetomidium leptoderma TaxID=669021 RepID=A0AAN6VKV3_9PEZI|nr:hypothetical protein C8A00DRAFT_33794 [Chaetomidium leptoderma]